MIIQSAGGPITTAIDVSDSDIVSALSLGENDVTASNFSLTEFFWEIFGLPVTLKSEAGI